MLKEKSRIIIFQIKRIYRKNIYFVGRLVSYKYFNMDQAIRNALDYYENELHEI